MPEELGLEGGHLLHVKVCAGQLLTFISVEK